MFRQDVTDRRDRLGEASDWWVLLTAPAGGNGTDPSFFYCNARVGKPITSEAMAQASPYFVGNVSEFRVEFAGDFVTQNPANGDVMAAEPDGIIDFVVDNNHPRRVRWYGLPRDVDEDGVIVWQYDVVPVRDLRARSAVAPPLPTAPFERVVPTMRPNYWDDVNKTYIVDQPYIPYICIWVNGSPAMVRVAMKLEDPARRIQEGRWCEYVLPVR
jgi:hypothetical protein